MINGQMSHPIWIRYLQIGDGWMTGQVSITQRSNFQIVFEIVRNSRTSGYIGLDDVQLLDYNCPNPENCNFESGKCTWSNNIIGDELDWVLNTGGSGSSRSGPSKDHTIGTDEGTYLYLQGTDADMDDSASLYSEPLPGSKDHKCLEFWYHMYGAGMGTLRIDIATNDDTSFTIWTLSGDQGNSWQYGRVPYRHVKEYQLIFVGVRGSGINSDIAIDDVVISDGICIGLPTEATVLLPTPATTCDFEYPISECGWYEGTPDDNFNWHRARAYDLRHTPELAPAADHTHNSKYNYFVYLVPVGAYAIETAEYLSPQFSTAAPGCRLDLWLYMDGIRPYTLEIYLIQGDTDVKLWAWYQSFGDEWQNVIIGVGLQTGPWQINISSVISKTISVIGHNLLVQMNLTGSDYQDQLSLAIQDQVMIIHTQTFQMRFFYHMYGTNMGKLNIYTRIYDNTNQGQTRVWQQTGENGAFWDRAEVTFNINSAFQVVFEGVAGDSYYGNIALDDITFTTSCSLSSISRLPTAPPTTPPPFPPSTTLHPACETGEFYCTADNVCIAPQSVCDFYSDCSDGQEETDRCINSTCDFEDDMCGWVGAYTGSRKRRDKPQFAWDRQQGSTAMPTDYRPSTDHTKGTSSGYYLYADNSPGTYRDTTNITTPLIGQTGPNCHLEFWYHMGGSNSGSLQVFTQFGNVTHLKFTLSGASGDEWKRGLLFIGTDQMFKIIVSASRGSSYYGDTCIDDIKFLECAPPVISGVDCTNEEFRCTNGFCIDKKKVCNFVDDCMDNSDEDHCDNLVGRCSFELDTCGWKQESGDEFDWTFYSSATSSYSTGPSTDHTYRTTYGQYAYIETSNPRTFGDRARLASQTIKGASTGCRIMLWYHMLGPTIGSFSVLLRTSYLNGDSDLQVLTNVTGEQGDYWWPLDVTIYSEADFKIVLEGMTGSYFTGDIAIDDVSFSSECISGGSIPGEVTTTDTPLPTCVEDERMLACQDGSGCFYTWQRCNFYPECTDESDEKNCGKSCNFESGLCGWINSLSDQFDWTLEQGSTPSIKTGPTSDHTFGNEQGHYMYTEADAEPRKSIAHLQTLPYQHSREDCQLTFWYHMYDFYDRYMGTLTIYIKYGNHKPEQIWSVAGNRGDLWQSATAVIGRHEEFIIIIEGKRGLSIYSDIAIDDLKFENCYDANYIRPCDETVEFECQVESRCLLLDKVCDYKPDCQDGSDEIDCGVKPGDCHFDYDKPYCDYEQLDDDDFDWIAGITTPSNFSGPDFDHTVANTSGNSQFLYVDSTVQNEGQIARIATTIFFPASNGVCTMRFWYHMLSSFANDVGILRVYTESDVENDQRLFMWQKSRNMGKHWNYAKVVLSNPHSFRVVFEVIMGEKEQSDIAIDDITFTKSCHSPDDDTAIIPGICTRNQIYCPGDQICISKSWLNDGNIDCPTDCYDEEQFRYNCDAGIVAGAVIGGLVVAGIVIILVVVTLRKLKGKHSNYRFGSSSIFDDKAGGVFSVDNPVYDSTTSEHQD
uniref:Apical endosomal glycoprotein-like n=1 Tax=Saccoglossus kowalevskii TaxID=10224 RepID=A0ABM0MM39_SACKO|nr:PREDICTED: apical endosomal glycoprotein-like [Saccoglossus kowalevskii]